MSVEVAISGLGVVTAAGVGKRPFWEAVSTGKSAVHKIERFDTSAFRCRIGAEISFEIELPGLRSNPAVWDLSARAGLEAVRQAAADAGFEKQLSSAGLYWGSAVGGIISLDEQFENYYTRGPRWVVPATVPKTMLNAAASLIAIESGIRGPNLTLASACSASSHAIAVGYDQIRSGAIEACIVGGADCPIAPGHLQAWDRLRALSPENDSPHRACRPFSKNRNGLVLGEGAAAFVLERADLVRRRGVNPIAFIRGYAANCDASSVIEPSSEGQQKCIELARSAAGWENLVPDYIAAHATGTSDGDRCEVRALKGAFPNSCEQLLLSSIKSTIGHTLGASGAISLAAVLLAMREGVVPPTANHEQFDPECDLDCVPNQPRKADVERALVNSFAFGGSNVVLALERA